MKKSLYFFFWISLLYTTLPISAETNLAQKAYSILEQNCLNCHGQSGAFREKVVIDHSFLIKNELIVPGNPDASVFYQRLISTDITKRMPLGQPELSTMALTIVREWISEGASDWKANFDSDRRFVSLSDIFETMGQHLLLLPASERRFARYFTLTHLYNAGVDSDTLTTYAVALSKLVNSLSWGSRIVSPIPIDLERTIFYIDIRDYNWGTEKWSEVERLYPYKFDFNPKTELYEMLSQLQEDLDCEVPLIYGDWFLATVSLPPLYDTLLDTPATDIELERKLGVDVIENIRHFPGKNVVRAGFNNSGVSKNNRIVERHVSRYGAYWKSYDFAGSIGIQNIFARPLSFRHNGGEAVYNLPNGLQGYFISDASGNRIGIAPIEIVSNPAASDPSVRNGLSCLGCHTEGIKDFEDGVREVVEGLENPPFNKAHVMRLYVEKDVMNTHIAEDKERYRVALESTGGLVTDIEPVFRFHEVFHSPLDAVGAASAIGLETDTFIQGIRSSDFLRSRGLSVFETFGGSMNRDAWTSVWRDVLFAFNFPQNTVQDLAVPSRYSEVIPNTVIEIPDANLRDVIEETLGTAEITTTSIEMLDALKANHLNIRSLDGLQFAVNLRELWISGNPITDLSPLSGCVNLEGIGAWHVPITDLSPLAGLVKLRWLEFVEGKIVDLTPLSRLLNLRRLYLYTQRISDLSPLASLTNLNKLRLTHNRIVDVSPLSDLRELEFLAIYDNAIRDISALSGLQNLETLRINDNRISDISGLANLQKLTLLDLTDNEISDVTPLSSLTNLRHLGLTRNRIVDISPLSGFLESEDVNVSWGENPGFPTGGEKLTDGWLWLWLPAAHYYNVDMLSEISDGEVTEYEIATQGAVEGNRVGSRVWTAHEISPVGSDNVRQLGKKLGWGQGNEFHDTVLYGSLKLHSPREQTTTMFLGCDDGVKVWLNGDEVFEKKGSDNLIQDYQTFFPVTLKKGENILLVVLDDRNFSKWAAFFGFATDTIYTLPGKELLADVNMDGIVNILDLVLVSNTLGKKEATTGFDLNKDGEVNILDLVLIASQM